MATIKRVDHRSKTASLSSRERNPSSSLKRLRNGQGSKADIHDSQPNDMKMSIGRFVYESGLSFNAINLPSFQRMISLYSKEKCEVPSCQELKGWIFEDTMKEMHAYVGEVRKSWAVTGCSILLDQWTDAKGRDLVNVLTDCPTGTVYLCSYDISGYVGNVDSMLSFLEKILQEVGKDNVVQIITNSTSAFMKEVGEQFTENYRQMFWTVSASYCIGLMLEKLMGLDMIRETLDKAKTITRYIYSHQNALRCLKELTGGRDLVNPSVVQASHPFLTLETILVEQESLKKMFLKPDMRSSFSTSSMEVESVVDLVADQSFWNETSIVVDAVIPLVRIIECLNKAIKPAMGYMHETVDQAKEDIKQCLEQRKTDYKQVWEAIDGVWDEFLHNPLQSTGYLLNPFIFYSDDLFIDPQTLTDVVCCIVRSTRDICVLDRLSVHLDQYRIAAKGTVGAGLEVDQESDMSPAQWWSEYGKDCPELQRLAIRTLSQTCDGASRFQLDKSLVERFLSVEICPTEKKRLSDMAFIQYNMKLQNFGAGKTLEMEPSEMDPTDEWIVDKAQTDMSQNDEATWMRLDDEKGNANRSIKVELSPVFHPKVEPLN